MVLVTFLGKVLGPGRGAEELSLLWVRYHSMLAFEHLSNLIPGFGKRLGALSLYVQGDFDCTAFVNQNIAKGAVGYFGFTKATYFSCITSKKNLGQTLCSNSDQKFSFMTKPHHQHHQQ